MANTKNKIGASEYITAASGIAGTIGSALNSDINQNYINQIGNTILDNINTFNNIDTSSADAFELSSMNFGNHLGYVTKKDVMGMSGLENTANIFLNSALGAGSGAAAGPWGALVGGLVGLGTGMFGGIRRRNKAIAQTKRLNDAIFAYNKLADARLANAASQTNMNIMNKLMLNLLALGGSTHGSDFSNDIIQINNGGTHEENPNNGILVGIDNEGVPNLVEEGEVIWNDYVFSNRTKVPLKVKDKYKLGKQDMSFADAAKKIQKESEETPNDEISKRGVDANLTRLMEAQEEIRNRKQMRLINKYKLMLLALSDTNLFPYGGDIKAERVTGFNYYPKELELLNHMDKLFADNMKSIKKDLVTNYKPFRSPYLKDLKDPKYMSYLRYAPAVENALALFQAALSKPNYSTANTILNTANTLMQYPRVSYSPINLYLTYRPTDVNAANNRIIQQRGAANRNYANITGGNRGALAFDILANNYATQLNIGQNLMNAEEVNRTRLKDVAEFNRGTDAMNMQLAMEAAKANQSAYLGASNARANYIAKAMELRQGIESARNAAIAHNFSSIFDTLGNIGIDEYNRRMKDTTIDKVGIPGSEEYKKRKHGGKIKRYTY